MMQNFAEAFTKYMDKEGVKYIKQNDHVVTVVYSGNNMESIPIFVFFDEDNEPLVTFKCWSIMNFKRNEAAALVVCNTLNSEYRWVKFYLDTDKDIVASLDAMVSIQTCGEECLFLARRMVNILDNAYPRIAKVRRE